MTAAVLTGVRGLQPAQTMAMRLACRDERAFRSFYRTHAAAVFRIARRFSCSDADAEEVVQETFIAVFKTVSSFRGEARLSTWLYRVTVNQALKRARWRRRRRETPDVVLSPQISDRPSPESEIINRQAAQVLLERCLDRIDEKKRVVLVLYELEHLDTRQIAEVLQINRSTVLTRLARGRAELRSHAAACGVL